MIQRIQSVWLLLASVASFLTLQFPYYIGTNAEGIASYKLTGKENFLLLVTTVIIGLLALVTIFFFKKRVLQLRLCVLGIVLEAVLIFLYYREVNTFIDGQGGYALTALLHSIVVITFFLAGRSINKDEKLIKHSDRLR